VVGHSTETLCVKWRGVTDHLQLGHGRSSVTSRSIRSRVLVPIYSFVIDEFQT
jgi:hypothetical protein